MSRKAERGRREFVAIIIAAVLIQMLIGAVGSFRGDSIAWGSLLHRPLMLGALCIAAMVTRRSGYIALTAWFAWLGSQYVYGGFNASYNLLRIMRWIAAIFFLWSTVRLATSVHIRAHRDERHVRS